MTTFPIGALRERRTPFYFYDIDLLDATLAKIRECSSYPGFHVHYAVKANVNPEILKIISKAGFGADLVSGGEIKAALDAGFKPQDMVFAGVGKSDWEIELALDAGIGCLNVESDAELDAIERIAERKCKVATVALRVNPNIDAHTHHYITTGLAENKFGIAMEQLDPIVLRVAKSPVLDLAGLHFHIGSQITITEPFKMLCNKIIELCEHYRNMGIEFRSINVGGGLGIDYDDPDANPIPDFESYFKSFHDNLPIAPGQQLHFELGRSVVGQCGSLITSVIYVKEGVNKKFAIVDAGFSELIRPALYQAHHLIQNLTSHDKPEKYDVVGPICESSDTFGVDEVLPKVKRGDIFALRSAGAYGEIMASHYNCRSLNPAFLYSKSKV